jgi:hypothetical protein
MENWSEAQGDPNQPVEPNQASEQPQPVRPWGAPAQAPEEPRYLGLSPAHFNLAFFAVLGVIALAAFLFLGGVSAVSDLVGGDEPAKSTVSTPTDSAGTGDDTTAPTIDDSTAGDTSGDTSGGNAVTNVLGTFDPLSLVGALSSGEAPTLGDPIAGSEVDGSLSDALIQEGDLPAGFQSAGEMSFSMPVEGATADMAMRMFASGDLESGDFGTMVMSAAIESAEMANAGDFDPSQLSEEDLAEATGAMSSLGINVTELRLLDASGLGEGGFGMHMQMDFAELFAGFGELTGAEDVPTAMAFDMYAWVRGDRMYMVMVMSTSGDFGVDGRALADTMDDRAG